MKESPKNNDSVILKSYGAVGGLVTGSCHLIQIENSKIMVDAGLFQGRDEERVDNGNSRNSDPATKSVARGVTQILVTHAHIDHTGLIPKFFREGFTPTILTTVATEAFMEPMLGNSADIQKSEKRSERLYNQHDVDKALKHIRMVEPFKEIAVGQKKSSITAEFLLNGHVIGGASIVLRNPDGKKNILFTGDMGKPDQSLCGGYKDYISKYPSFPINTLVVESTNFERGPVLFEEKEESFMEAIHKTWKDGGNPIFPTLSFHRTQEIMEMLHNGQKKGLIPKDCEIYIDAPLAMKLLETFKELGPNHLSPRYGDNPNFYKSPKSSMDRFTLKNVVIVKSHKESQLLDQSLATSPEKTIIIASGGMGGYGRAVNYLRGEFGKNPKNTVLLTCYQVAGTDGANLLSEGKVTRGNQEGAKVIKIEGFTSHISGPKETFDFLERFNLTDLQTVIVTHGRDPAREAMATEFKARGYSANVILPRIGQEIEI